MLFLEQNGFFMVQTTVLSYAFETKQLLPYPRAHHQNPRDTQCSVKFASFHLAFNMSWTGKYGVCRAPRQPGTVAETRQVH